MTDAMRERASRLAAEWKHEGDGYFSLVGDGRYAELAYIALPSEHPDVGKGDDELDPPVNGGLTFADDNVFGWDYGHAFNSGSTEGDIASALAYFRKRINRGSNVQPV